MTQKEIIEKYWPKPQYCNVPNIPAMKEAIGKMMDEWAKEKSIEYFDWVNDTYTTDESRLPLSYNRELGGRTIYIDGEEIPIKSLYSIYKNNQ